VNEIVQILTSSAMEWSPPNKLLRFESAVKGDSGGQEIHLP
jgi:hypothetical protein